MSKLFENIGAVLFNKKEILPATKERKLLMLMGAMYVEETNNSLENIEEVYGDEFEKNPDISKWSIEEIEDLKYDLMEEFCGLDMQLSGAYKDDAKELLEEWWNIYDKESAVDMLNWLKNSGHRKYFNEIFENIDKLIPLTAEKAINFINECSTKGIETDGFEDKAIENITEEELVESDFYQNLLYEIEFTKEVMDDCPKCKILAWDMARYIHVVRLCYVAKYFEDKECWELIDKICDICVSSFENWEEFNISFLIGRNFWNGYDPEDPIAEICTGLISDNCSPWNYFEWQKSL